MVKRNCWEIKKCGRHEGGEHVNDLGVCPAAISERLDGTHGGRNAGRACWVVAGTMCGGSIQGTFAQKYNQCEKCEFYKTVKSEEGSTFEMSIVLLNRMRALENREASVR